MANVRVMFNGHPIDATLLERNAVVDIITQLVDSQGWTGFFAEKNEEGWVLSFKEAEQ